MYIVYGFVLQCKMSTLHGYRPYITNVFVAALDGLLFGV